jgi:hypothetical protein
MSSSHPINPNSRDLLKAVEEGKQMVHDCCEMSKNVSRLEKEAAAVNCIIGNDEAPGVGGTLIKTGTLLIAFPEPVVSGIAGVALVATGLVLNKLRKSSNVKELYKEHQRSMKDMQRLQREILQTTLFR